MGSEEHQWSRPFIAGHHIPKPASGPHPLFFTLQFSQTDLHPISRSCFLPSRLCFCCSFCPLPCHLHGLNATDFFQTNVLQ